MDGFYSIWSKPYLEKKKTTEYRMHDFELLTFILSNLIWQKTNGKTSLIADDIALKYLERLNILRLFDGNIISFNVPDNINSNIFWAAGKLYALKSLNKNLAMIDLDLIVWQDMSKLSENYDIFVIHREEITDHVYPDFEKFKVKDEYKYNKNWSKDVNPCNTALLCYKDLDFIKQYCDESILFMKSCLEKSDNLCPMVFAEQRLISIMAQLNGKSIGSIFPFAGDIGNQDIVTHIWGHKNILKYNYEERMKFCKRILNRIKDENQNTYEICANIKMFKPYL